MNYQGVKSYFDIKAWIGTYDIEADDISMAEWRYKDGKSARMYVTTDYPMQAWYTRLEVLGTKGVYVLISGGPEGTHTWWSDGKKWTEEPPFPYKREWAYGSDNFSWCLRTGDKLVCTAEDLLKVAQFTMNGGRWDGKQLLNEKFVKDATSCLITNNHLEADQYCNKGYGYYIWRTLRNSYFFNGMGCQFAICVPDKELIFIYNADNQGLEHAKKVIIDNFFTLIADTASDEELDTNNELEGYADTLILTYAKGEKHLECENKINGVTYKLNENPMKIRDIKVVIDGDKGKLCYNNEQGYKELVFGLGYNEFSKFPQDGYADEVGTIPGNRRFDCAVSAAWIEPRKLFIKVQIIDNYFGRLNIILSYREDMKLGITMNKTAEDFLDEYSGIAGGEPI